MVFLNPIWSARTRQDRYADHILATWIVYGSAGMETWKEAVAECPVLPHILLLAMFVSLLTYNPTL
jgi:hypothetical protein